MAALEGVIPGVGTSFGECLCILDFDNVLPINPFTNQCWSAAFLLKAFTKLLLIFNFRNCWQYMCWTSLPSGHVLLILTNHLPPNLICSCQIPKSNKQFYISLYFLYKVWSQLCTREEVPANSSNSRVSLFCIPPRHLSAISVKCHLTSDVFYAVHLVCLSLTVSTTNLGGARRHSTGMLTLESWLKKNVSSNTL